MAENKGKILSIPLDDELDALVRKCAEEKRLSLADVGRQALLHYFEANK